MVIDTYDYLFVATIIILIGINFMTFLRPVRAGHGA